MTCLHPIIAAANSETWQMVEHVSFIVTILVGVIAYLTYRRKRETRRIEPNPIRTRRVLEKATEENCKDRHESCMQAIERIAEENSAEHKRLYDQIDIVERRAEDNVKATVKDINNTILDMPERIIDLLSKTGQLKDHHSRPDK